MMHVYLRCNKAIKSQKTRKQTGKLMIFPDSNDAMLIQNSVLLETSFGLVVVHKVLYCLF
jgi:hypothetical protein